MSTVSHAPGKALIAGEYAVLFGHPAIVTAVDRWATCTYTPQPSMQFCSISKNVAHSGKDDRIFRCAVDACIRFGFIAKTGRYCLDTTQFFDQQLGIKLGLGSSAAATVALCKMILNQHNVHSRATLLSCARVAHHAFCYKTGSGADIAAACYETVIRFIGSSASPMIEVISAPPYLNELIFIHTRHSQTTHPFVEAVCHYKDRDAQFFTHFLSRSDEIVAALANSRCTVLEAIPLFSQYERLLRELGNRAEIPIVSDDHRTIAQNAATYQGAAKPSGAGGGDISIALIPEQERAAFKNRMKQLGYSVLSLSYIGQLHEKSGESPY